MPHTNFASGHMLCAPCRAIRCSALRHRSLFHRRAAPTNISQLNPITHFAHHVLQNSNFLARCSATSRSCAWIATGKWTCEREIHCPLSHYACSLCYIRYVRQLQHCLRSSCGIACIMLLGDKIGTMSNPKQLSSNRKLQTRIPKASNLNQLTHVPLLTVAQATPPFPASSLFPTCTCSSHPCRLSFKLSLTSFMCWTQMCTQSPSRATRCTPLQMAWLRLRMCCGGWGRF